MVLNMALPLVEALEGMESVMLMKEVPDDADSDSEEKKSEEKENWANFPSWKLEEHGAGNWVDLNANSFPTLSCLVLPGYLSLPEFPPEHHQFARA